FINNKTYNNVLLYGDAGTGKSSSIKPLSKYSFNKALIELDLPVPASPYNNTLLYVLLFIKLRVFSINCCF
ncbi:MAG: ATP-binding protein, partial [Acholeplasmatales bacterium]|nr:ATP-binding protein [Acholeplasmatales bacterium]